MTPSGVPVSLAANSATTTPVSIGVCAGSNAPIQNPGPVFSVTVT
jgi:hypothetical protein